jgi:hypothetical protein
MNTGQCLPWTRLDDNNDAPCSQRPPLPHPPMHNHGPAGVQVVHATRHILGHVEALQGGQAAPSRGAVEQAEEGASWHELGHDGQLVGEHHRA